MIKNPWIDIEKFEYFYYKRRQYVLEFDEEYYYGNRRYRNYIDFSWLPEPYIWDPNAKIYILMWNPNIWDPVAKWDSRFRLLLDNLRHTKKEGKNMLYFFNDSFCHSTKHNYWLKVFDPLIQEYAEYRKIDIKDISKLKEIYTWLEKLFFICELYWYHSSSTDYSILLKSMKYTKYLVENHINKQDNNYVLLTRARSKWFELIDGLDTYNNCLYPWINQSIRLDKNTIPPILYKFIFTELDRHMA